jgi:hypothetical protein
MKLNTPILMEVLRMRQIEPRYFKERIAGPNLTSIL